MKFTIGFSPCPNDTFIFDALVNNKIDTGGIEFEPVLEDVQTLNEWTLSGKLDVCKISYGALPLVSAQYAVLHSGGALGKGVGPLLISKKEIPESAVKRCVVAVPGQNTTANVLFSMAFPEAIHKVYLRYDQVENFVASTDSEADIDNAKLGVIIHENRFTYQSKGLVKVRDLGEIWEENTGYPIPLGCIIMRRSVDTEIHFRVEQLIRESLQYSWNQYPELSEFVKEHAQEMDESVMRQHIELYVNEHSMDLGPLGIEAVRKFIQTHSSINKLPVDLDNLFIRH